METGSRGDAGPGAPPQSGPSLEPHLQGLLDQRLPRGHRVTGQQVGRRVTCGSWELGAFRGGGVALPHPQPEVQVRPRHPQFSPSDRTRRILAQLPTRGSRKAQGGHLSGRRTPLGGAGPRRDPGSAGQFRPRKPPCRVRTFQSRALDPGAWPAEAGSQRVCPERPRPRGPTPPDRGLEEAPLPVPQASRTGRPPRTPRGGRYCPGQSGGAAVPLAPGLAI